MAWPKIIEIGGMKVPIDSWEELKDAYYAVTAYGIPLTESEDANGTVRKNDSSGVPGLNPGDKTLLAQFVEAADRGLLTGQLAQAVGKKGKGVRPALERWSRRIGLVTDENTSAFAPVKRFDGRGFIMTDHFRRTAASMIGKSIS